MDITAQIEMISFVMLAAAMLALYTPYRSVAFGLLSVSVMAALYTGVVMGIGVVSATALAVLCYFTASTGDGQHRRSHSVFLAGVIIVSLLMALHLIPGFQRVPIVSNVLLSPQAIPFTLALGYDKALAGTLLVLFLVQVARTKDRWRKTVGATLRASMLTLACIIPLGLLLGIFTFDAKLSSYLGVWVFSSLFITAIAEEAFFRRLLQENLAAYLTGKVNHAAGWAILVVAIMFSLAHAGGGLGYAVLVFFAGCGYGLAYKWGGGLEAAVGTHFIVNLVHFLFFTYPMLAR